MWTVVVLVGGAALAAVVWRWLRRRRARGADRGEGDGADMFESDGQVADSFDPVAEGGDGGD